MARLALEKRLCLESILPVSHGAYVVLDDYHDYDGRRRAVEDFLERAPEDDLRGRRVFQICWRFATGWRRCDDESPRRTQAQESQS